MTRSSPRNRLCLSDEELYLHDIHGQRTGEQTTLFFVYVAECSVDSGFGIECTPGCRPYFAKPIALSRDQMVESLVTCDLTTNFMRCTDVPSGQISVVLIDFKGSLMEGFMWGIVARTLGQCEDTDDSDRGRRGEGGGEPEREVAVEEGPVEEGEEATETIKKAELSLVDEGGGAVEGV